MQEVMTTPRAALAGLLAASVALTACGGGDDDGDDSGERPAASVPAPSVPSGFSLRRGQDYAFVYPSSWKVQPERKEPRGSIQSVLGPAGESGLPPQIAVGRTPRDSGSFDQALKAFRADSQVTRARWKVTAEHPVKLAGATDARLIEASYLQPTPKKTTETVRTIDLLVRTERGTQLNLLVRAPETDFDRARLRAVVDSFRVG
jgi:hypothetical protein